MSKIIWSNRNYSHLIHRPIKYFNSIIFVVLMA